MAPILEEYNKLLEVLDSISKPTWVDKWGFWLLVIAYVATSIKYFSDKRTERKSTDLSRKSQLRAEEKREESELKLVELQMKENQNIIEEKKVSIITNINGLLYGLIDMEDYEINVQSKINISSDIIDLIKENIEIYDEVNILLLLNVIKSEYEKEEINEETITSLLSNLKSILENDN